MYYHVFEPSEVMNFDPDEPSSISVGLRVGPGESSTLHTCMSEPLNGGVYDIKRRFQYVKLIKIVHVSF